MQHSGSAQCGALEAPGHSRWRKRGGRQRPMGQRKKNNRPQFFFFICYDSPGRCRPHSLFFPSSPHSITASPPTDNFSPTLPGCLPISIRPLPSSLIATASVLSRPFRARLYAKTPRCLCRPTSASPSAYFPTARLFARRPNRLELFIQPLSFGIANCSTLRYPRTLRIP